MLPHSSEDKPFDVNANRTPAEVAAASGFRDGPRVKSSPAIDGFSLLYCALRLTDSYEDVYGSQVEPASHAGYWQQEGALASRWSFTSAQALGMDAKRVYNLLCYDTRLDAHDAQDNEQWGFQDTRGLDLGDKAGLTSLLPFFNLDTQNIKPVARIPLRATRAIERDLVIVAEDGQPAGRLAYVVMLWRVGGKSELHLQVHLNHLQVIHMYRGKGASNAALRCVAHDVTNIACALAKSVHELKDEFKQDLSDVKPALKVVVSSSGMCQVDHAARLRLWEFVSGDLEAMFEHSSLLVDGNEFRYMDVLELKEVSEQSMASN